jgi:hypothetical protein
MRQRNMLPSNGLFFQGQDMSSLKAFPLNGRPTSADHTACRSKPNERFAFMHQPLNTAANMPVLSFRSSDFGRGRMALYARILTSAA